MEVIPKNCVNNFTDYKVVLASREGKEYHQIIDLSNKHPLLQQTEWSDVPDDTEWEVPGLPAPEVGPQALALPLNDSETYRIRRALLRYEVFCSLFYLGPDTYFDRQQHPHRFNPGAFVKAQAIFLKKYVKPWEIGELAVVSQFMYDLVRYVLSTRGRHVILHIMSEYSTYFERPRVFCSLLHLAQPPAPANPFNVRVC